MGLVDLVPVDGNPFAGSPAPVDPNDPVFKNAIDYAGGLGAAQPSVSQMPPGFGTLGDPAANLPLTHPTFEKAMPYGNLEEAEDTSQGWPTRIAAGLGYEASSKLAGLGQAAWNAFTLPGDVAKGIVDPNSDEAIQRSTDLAGMLTMPAASSAVADPSALGIFAGAKSATADLAANDAKVALTPVAGNPFTGTAMSVGDTTPSINWDRSTIGRGEPLPDHMTVVDLPTGALDAVSKASAPDYHVAEPKTQVATYAASGAPMSLPEIGATDGRIGFQNGRNRVAAALANGEPTVPVAVEKNNVGDVYNALGISPAPAIRTSSVAKKFSWMYNPSDVKPRPFEADYPSGAPSDGSGKLTTDIEGRPLTAGFVVGRNVVGGPEEALSPAQSIDVGTQAIGAGPATVPSRTIGGDAGRLVRTINPSTGDPEYNIQLNKNLAADQVPLVYSHELAHAIDELSGQINTAGLNSEMRSVYNTLNNPQKHGKPFGPENAGYKGSDVPRELMAESIRAYMANPNYLKTVAPKTAASIRAAVNNNPKLSKIIQFNSLAGAGLGLGAGAAAFMGQDRPAQAITTTPVEGNPFQ